METLVTERFELSLGYFMHMTHCSSTDWAENWELPTRNVKVQYDSVPLKSFEQYCMNGWFQVQCGTCCFWG